MFLAGVEMGAKMFVGLDRVADCPKQRFTRGKAIASHLQSGGCAAMFLALRIRSPFFNSP
jgi:hypothetical protein